MKQFDWSECDAVWADPARLGGAPAFRGTRVPISALFNNLGSGATVGEFLEWFPGVTAEQVGNVLAFAGEHSTGLPAIASAA